MERRADKQKSRATLQRALATNWASYSSSRGLVVGRDFKSSRAHSLPLRTQGEVQPFCSFNALQPVLWYMGHSRP
jgi:hypothetical protein